MKKKEIEIARGVFAGLLPIWTVIVSIYVYEKGFIVFAYVFLAISLWASFDIRKR